MRTRVLPMQLSKKNEFKASNYMGELKERQDELNAARMKIIDQEEMMRLRDNQTKHLVSERDYLQSELKKLDIAFKDLSRKFED